MTRVPIALVSFLRQRVGGDRAALDVHDHAGFVDTVADADGHGVVGRSLYYRPYTVAGRVERLAAEQTVRECVGTERHLDLAHHEALDVVYVEALVHPGDQQGLGTLGLGSNLAHLPRLDLGRIDQQGEDAERRFREGCRARLAPPAHAAVPLPLSALPPRAPS